MSRKFTITKIDLSKLLCVQATTEFALTLPKGSIILSVTNVCYSVFMFVRTPECVESETRHFLSCSNGVAIDEEDDEHHIHLGSVAWQGNASSSSFELHVFEKHRHEFYKGDIATP